MENLAVFGLTLFTLMVVFYPTKKKPTMQEQMDKNLTINYWGFEK